MKTKILNCPYCQESMTLKINQVDTWLEKTYTCKVCEMPFIVFADRHIGLFFVDKFSKPLTRLKPCLIPKVR